jgi:hypothetical protein
MRDLPWVVLVSDISTALKDERPVVSFNWILILELHSTDWANINGAG